MNEGDSMRILTAKQIKAVEENAFKTDSTEAGLMLNAGTACFEKICKIFGESLANRSSRQSGRAANDTGTVGLDGIAFCIVFLHNGNVTRGGENLVLQTGVPAFQVADHRRHALGDRLREHGFPQLRTQFRSQRFHL